MADCGIQLHNGSKINLLPSSPTFTLPTPYCSTHLLTRFVGVLGGLADPRTTSPRSPRWVFPGGVHDLFGQRSGVRLVWPFC
jgi:hypothetical protein